MPQVKVCSCKCAVCKSIERVNFGPLKPNVCQVLLDMCMIHPQTTNSVKILLDQHI